MFSHLRLINFQAHRVMDIPLGPAITTIIGSTDIGKSAILRALRWVCLNNFAGSDFIREGKRFTRVVLTLDNGTKVTREKTKDLQTNTYQIDKKPYRSFGQGVPQDVLDLLEMDTINFQGQHDSPFWFTESPGEVSRRMNAVVDLTIIDTALANIASSVRKSTDRIALAQEQVTEARTKFRSLRPLKERIVQFNSLKERHSRLEELDAKCKRLETLLDTSRTIRAKTLREKADQLQALLASAERAITLERKCKALGNLVQSIEQLQRQTTPPPSFAHLELAYAKLEKLTSQANELSSTIRRIQEARLNRDAQAEALVQAEKTFHAETKGQTCPLCQNIIK